MTDYRQIFSQTYSDARALRGTLCNDFVTCGDVEVFVSDTRTLSVGRTGDYGDKPGFYAACISSGVSSKSGRRYFLEQSRSCGRVPLPR